MTEYVQKFDEVYVYLNDTTMYEAKDVTIDQDRCKFFNALDTTYISFPTYNIQKIQVKNYPMGFIEGTCLGGGTSMLILGVYAASTSGGGDMAGLGVILLALSGLLIGGVGGGIIGIVDGSTNEYIIPHDSLKVNSNKSNN